MWLIFAQADVATIAISSLMLLALSITARSALARAARVSIRLATHRCASAPPVFISKINTDRD